VITAAHCIQAKNDIQRIPEASLFYIGKHYLKSPKFTEEKNYIVSPVTRFIVHPDWQTQGQSYDADIAIAILSQFVYGRKQITITTFSIKKASSLDMEKLKMLKNLVPYLIGLCYQLSMK
jgi:hypothetical protein